MIIRSQKCCLLAILFSGSFAISGNSFDGFSRLIASLRVGLGSSIGNWSIPFLKNRVVVNSFELASRSMTINDLCALIANKCGDIAEDLKFMGVIARQLWAALLFYIHEKPANAAIIGTGVAISLLALRHFYVLVTNVNRRRHDEVIRRRVLRDSVAIQN